MINISYDIVKNICIIYIEGSLSIESISEAEDIWGQVLNEKPEIIAMNFRLVEHVDSIGINHLFKFAKSAISNDSELVIFDVNKGIKRVFEITKLDKFYKIIDKAKFDKDYIKTST